MSEVRRQVTLPPRPNWGWQDAAACRGTDVVLFFGPDGERQPERDIRERKAKALCASCPVRTECLDYAISRPEKYGTWGGLNEDERASERRRRMEVRRQVTLPPRPNWGWQDAAACRGTDVVLFFGPDGERQPEREIRERKAKAMCASCPVRSECLDYAISRPEKYGTWGGLNEDERASERRRRMRRANAA